MRAMGEGWIINTARLECDFTADDWRAVLVLCVIWDDVVRGHVNLKYHVYSRGYFSRVSGQEIAGTGSNGCQYLDSL